MSHGRSHRKNHGGKTGRTSPGGFYEAVREALTAPPPGKVRTWAEMSPEERESLRKLYEGRKP